MNPSRNLSGLLVIIFLVVVSCTPSEELIEAEHATLKKDDSILIYEETYTSSGASGACVGRVVDRWYGTDVPYESLEKSYENHFLVDNWTIWPEDVVPIWRKETDDGLFTFSINPYSDVDSNNPNFGYYRLPDSAKLEATNYQTVYIISISHMFPKVAERCFQR